MTLAAADPTTSYPGTGAGNSFPFPFPVFQSGDIAVSILNTNVVPNITYQLTNGFDYTVTGLNPSATPASSQGLVTLVNHSQAWLTGANLATGFVITLKRVVSLTQLSSFRNQGSFYPETIEDALDYLMMVCQQLTYIASAQGGAVGGGNAFIIADTSNGHTYQLVFTNGQLTWNQIT